MKIQSIKWLMAGALIIAGLVGCGGGGGSSQPAAGGTVIKGTASAGIIYPGTVDVYEVKSDGTKGTLLTSVKTDIDGKYTASLGSYSGAIQVEAYGTYTDEATSRSVTLTAAKPLHAVVDSVDSTTFNNRTVAVTPLTEVSWRNASANGTQKTPSTTIAAANKLVAQLYKISDIIGVEPVRPDNATMSGASQESQAYTLALSAMSKLASTATGATDVEKLDSILSRMETEVESGSISATTSQEFSNALATVSLSNDFPSATGQLSAFGKKSQTLTLTTSGTLPVGTKIYAIEGTLALPVDSSNQLKVSFRADSNNKTLSDVLLLTGVATGMGGADPVATYLAPQQQLNFSVIFNAKGTGVGIGDFAILTYEVATGATVSATDFAIAKDVNGVDILSIKDANGADISGVTLSFK